MEIMKLLPAGKDYLWGGTRLKKEFGKDINMTPLAETWECSVHPDGLSMVSNGHFKGRTLSEVLDEHREYLGLKVEGRNELPILVKFIDAKQNLSIQVHPDDTYARKYERQNGKSEMWYIVDANKGASITYGFTHPVSKEIVKTAAAEGNIYKYLQKVKVQKGDVFFVPAGTIHGIGAGIVVAEVQESSNVTYRVYDYGRVDISGKKRELHIDKAVDVMNMDAAPEAVQRHRFVHYYPGCSREILCRCKYFETERIQVTDSCCFSVEKESFQILLCIDGDGQVESIDEKTDKVRIHKGDCLFIPANIGRCRLYGKLEVLKIRC